MTKTKTQQAQEYAENTMRTTYPNVPLNALFKGTLLFTAYDIQQAHSDGHTACEQSLWRSVEEELPSNDEEVLCLMKSNGAIVSGFINRSIRTGRLEVATLPDFHFEDYGDYEPTHWMHIPSLPDTDTEKNG